ncbi:MAG: Lar family restriction alleviation protein, partial [Acetobacter orientalis]|uniref:Lar family restriction alleviation protein n=1 Tax=Acetobacter orientalis TaxID=146474 RepID=UPI0039ED217D
GMSEELKSCPFCGSDDVAYTPFQSLVRVICKNSECFALGPFKNTKSEAATAWNTRAGEKA